MKKTFRSYLNPIFKGCYRQELLRYMEEKECMPVIKTEIWNGYTSLWTFGLNCYNRVLDWNRMCRIGRKWRNFMENGMEFYPKAVYEAVEMLKRIISLRFPIYITENGTQLQ